MASEGRLTTYRASREVRHGFASNSTDLILRDHDEYLDEGLQKISRRRFFCAPKEIVSFFTLASACFFLLSSRYLFCCQPQTDGQCVFLHSQNISNKIKHIAAISEKPKCGGAGSKLLVVLFSFECRNAPYMIYLSILVVYAVMQHGLR